MNRPSSVSSSIRSRATIRSDSHVLESKGFSQQYYPNSLEFQIHSINIDEKAYRVHSRIRLQEKECSAIPYAHTVKFELNYHSVMFDTLKIDLLSKQLVVHKRFGQVAIKISDIPQFHGELLYTFPVVSAEKKDKELGTVVLLMRFEFYGTVSSFSTIKRSQSPVKEAESPTCESSATLRTEESLEGMMSEMNLVSERLDSKTSASDSDSTLSRRTHEYSKRSYQEGLDALKHLFAAVSQTGFPLTKLEFTRAIGLMQKYNEYYPTPKTFDVVEDDEKLRIAAYFLRFTIPSYGALAMNYFGYGKVTDFLKINQDMKAAMSHLKLEKKHMLAWEYSSDGLFNHKPCFFIVYDQNSHSIIVSIRGTFGVADAITDLNAEYVPFLDGSAHGGSLHSALWIKEHYYDKIKHWAKGLNTKALYLVGHSLGGAISSILLMLIRDEMIGLMGDQFECRAFNFATPPCVSKNLIPEFETFIETYVNEYDIVPKASYGAIMDFKELLILAASLNENAKLSKEEKLARIHELSIELKETNKHPRLFIPGQLYFMYKTSRIDPNLDRRLPMNDTGNPLIDHHEPHYVVERTIPEYLDDVHVKVDMVLHHFLNKYDNALRGAHDWLVNYKRLR
jgi:hypothetical protein